MKQTTLAVAALQVPPTTASSVGATGDPIARDERLGGEDTLKEQVLDALLHWLEENPALGLGVTWGVPWPQGRLSKNQTFTLLDDSEQSIPLQSWPLAYWPDGSLKWMAHATRPTAGHSFRLTVNNRASTAPSSVPQGIKVVENGRTIQIDTGLVRCEIPRKGAAVLQALERNGRVVAHDARLICWLQDKAEFTSEGATRRTHCESRIVATTVEQRGPIRTVVRVEGRQRSFKGREWLPFTLRFYFYAGSDAVRIVHSFVFDGNEEKDFICGLGLRFSVPLRDELHNRHVRFAGEDRGLWGEAVRGLTGLRRDPGEAVRKAQVAGFATPPVAEWEEAVRSHLELIPTWGDFTLSQLCADGFQIRKRTKAQHSWIAAGAGHRAPGVGYIGGPSGGVAFGLRDFWQKHPAQIDIRGANTPEAEVTLWLYSPEAPAMDLRFYHDGLGMDSFAKQREGLDITYEDYEPEFGTPYGVARTHELMLWGVEATPSREKLADFAQAVSKPPLLVASPAQYLDAKVFGGLWSLPDRSTPAKSQIEDQLDYLLGFFQNQVEQRRWYGFWDYGDVMHSHDSDRHVWRYDIGGFAWDNSELSPDLWLWYSFLRSGRADVFRFAEAMTRHTSEVDVHHIGRFKGLGSRHNVQHWGDSSKQARISNAAYKRFYYFLTADERVGDLLHDLVDSDVAVSQINVGRKLGLNPDSRKNAEHIPSLELGTNWCSVVAAWLTEWERTGNTKYRDKIRAGMQSIGRMPRGWLAGSGTYNAQTGELTNNGNKISLSHLNAVFGAVEINAEIIALLDVPEYKRAWLQYCELYNASQELQQAATGQEFGKLNLREAHSRLTAYAALQKGDAELAKRAWGEFYEGKAGLGVRANLTTTRVEGSQVLHPVEEGFGTSTNAASQWGLAAIQNLALVGEFLPPQPPANPRKTT